MEKHKMPLITDVDDLKGKYVFVRSALNVPIADGKVRDQFRIIQSLPTIQYLVEHGARVIVCSHLGKDGTESIAPVFEVLKAHMPVVLSSEVIGQTTTALRNALQDGEVLLLENVRKDAREMENDVTFAQELASLADVFVNDDFAASHRAHSSLHAICQFLSSYVGINFGHEYEELSKALTPVSPSLFILGGAKFETKMPLVEKFLSLYDHVFIGGALANDFFKAKGLEVGTSLVSEMSLEGSPLLTHPKILLPIDVTAVKNGVPRIVTRDAVAQDESILDVGTETMAMLTPYIRDAKTILWNGPLGNYEGGFQEQTLTCAKLIAGSDAFSVIGGGDTVASIEKLGNQEAYGFVSTAGGAMLTFLELGSLPALDALLEHSK
jgi:phosphoglycerate kinase